jgi:hypothetical protein
MSTKTTSAWTETFSETLSEHLYLWLAAYGKSELEARIQYIKDCAEVITKSPLYKQHVDSQELSEDFYLVCLVCISCCKLHAPVSTNIYLLFIIISKEICKEFVNYVIDDELAEEYVTPEERESAARPQLASEYKVHYTPSRVAPMLWPEEIKEVHGLSGNKGDKSNFGKYTVGVNKWFSDLPEDKLEEATRVSELWNSLACPDEKRMTM